MPVFLFPQDEFDRYLPLHFAWRERASVRVEPAEFLAGTVDLHATLSALNGSGAVLGMQRAIAHHARSLVYGLDGPLAGDAVDTFVRALAAALDAPPCSPACTSLLPAWRCGGPCAESH